MSTTELDRTSTGYEALAPEVRERWAVEQVQTIRKTVAKDLSIPEFQMGMALAAKYDLDPLLHEIWFAKDTNNDRPLIMTGRDGFLTIARRQSIYGGMAHDVVREQDDFSVEWENGTPNVRHKYKGDDEERGKIKGAWAVAYFEGKKPTYFYAPISEYMPTNSRKLQYSPWGSQLSVMMLKCAQSYVLRIGSGVTGLVGAEEAERALERSPGIAAGSGESEPIELPPEVEAVISRAESLGDPSNVIREVWQHHVDRGPDVLAAKVAEANAELDALERETITDAVVEPDVPIDTEGLPDPPAEADYVSPDPVGQEMGSLESPPEEPKLDREQLRKDLEAAQKKRPRTEDGRLQLQAEIECLQEDLAKAAKQAADEDPGQGTLI